MRLKGFSLESDLEHVGKVLDLLEITHGGRHEDLDTAAPFLCLRIKDDIHAVTGGCIVVYEDEIRLKTAFQDHNGFLGTVRDPVFCVVLLCKKRVQGLDSAFFLVHEKNIHPASPRKPGVVCYNIGKIIWFVNNKRRRLRG